MSRKGRTLLFFLLKIFVSAAVLFLLFGFVLKPWIIRGNRMYPSLRDGQLVFAFCPAEIRPDALVLYRTEEGKTAAGRVIASAGDQVEIDSDMGILVNGNFLVNRIPYPVSEGSISYPYTVPEDSFFLVNDYREDPEDSRSFGAVAKEQVIGVVVFALQYRDF